MVGSVMVGPEPQTRSWRASMRPSSAALSGAEQSTSQTGPALDNLKAAALAYETADRAAADRLDNPKVAWPASA
jgi:hypothetical protein